ncbi:MAG: hypothetical protein ACOYNI_10070 [Acidimicrobiia bacterium]
MSAMLNTLTSHRLVAVGATRPVARLRSLLRSSRCQSLDDALAPYVR